MTTTELAGSEPYPLEYSKTWANAAGQVMDRESTPKAESLVDGREYLERLSAILADAEKLADPSSTAILILAYRISPDISPHGRRSEQSLARQLAALALGGAFVDVRVSRHIAGLPNRQAYKTLRNAKVPVKWSPGGLRYASHEKLCIVTTSESTDLLTGSVDAWHPRWDDSEHAYANPDRYGRWTAPSHDVGVHVRFPGVNVVEEVKLHNLSTIWSRLSHRNIMPIHKIRNDNQLFLTMEEMLGGATRSIYIEDQYFLPDISLPQDRNRSLLNLLTEKVRAGVDVTVVLPAPSGRGSPRRLLENRSQSMIGELCAASNPRNGRVKVLGRLATDTTTGKARKLYVHSKLLVVDSEEVLIGSANFTTRSVFFDNEFALRITDESFASALEERLRDEHGIAEASYNRTRDAHPSLSTSQNKNSGHRSVDLSQPVTSRHWLLTNMLFRLIVDPPG